MSKGPPPPIVMLIHPAGNVIFLRPKIICKSFQSRQNCLSFPAQTVVFEHSPLRHSTWPWPDVLAQGGRLEAIKSYERVLRWRRCSQVLERWFLQHGKKRFTLWGSCGKVSKFRGELSTMVRQKGQLLTTFAVHDFCAPSSRESRKISTFANSVPLGLHAQKL